MYFNELLNLLVNTKYLCALQFNFMVNGAGFGKVGGKNALPTSRGRFGKRNIAFRLSCIYQYIYRVIIFKLKNLSLCIYMMIIFKLTKFITMYTESDHIQANKIYHCVYAG